MSEETKSANYLQIIEGSEMYYGWYVEELQQKNERLEVINDKLSSALNSAEKRIDKAIEIAYQYAQIDGDHHKMWVIDQIIRKLLKNNYDNWVKEYEEDGEYLWDTGINP